MGLFGRRREPLRQPLETADELELTNAREKTTFSASTSFGSPSPAPTAADSFAASSVAGERPMVFSSRGRKDIYIYEYSNRLEYYYKVGDYMTLIKTEAK